MGMEQDGKQRQRSHTDVDKEILSPDRFYIIEHIYSAFPLVAQKCHGENFVISERISREYSGTVCKIFLSHRVR
jgi:hypothetical protein